MYSKLVAGAICVLTLCGCDAVNESIDPTPPQKSSLRQVAETDAQDYVHNWALTSDGVYFGCSSGLCKLDRTGSRSVVISTEPREIPETLLSFKDGSLLLSTYSDQVALPGVGFAHFESGIQHGYISLNGIEKYADLQLLDHGKIFLDYWSKQNNREITVISDLDQRRSTDLTKKFNLYCHPTYRANGGFVFAMFEKPTKNCGPQIVVINSEGRAVGKRDLGEIASPWIPISYDAAGIWIKKKEAGEEGYDFYALSAKGFSLQSIKLGSSKELPQAAPGDHFFLKAGDMVWLGGKNFAWRSVSRLTGQESISLGTFRDQNLAINDVVLKNWNVGWSRDLKNFKRTDDGSLAYIEYGYDQRSARFVMTNPDGRERLSYSFSVSDRNDQSGFDVAGLYVLIHQKHAFKLFAIEND